VKYINGKQYRFGERWCSPMEALKEYFATIDDIKQGIAPDRNAEGLKLRDACEAFLRSRRTRQEAGELSKRSLQDYETEVEWMVGILGPSVTVDSLRPAHFTKLRRAMTAYSAQTTGNKIGRIRVVCKYFYDTCMVTAPVRFGPDFSRPSRATLRKDKASKPKKLFKPEEIHQIIAAANPQFKAMAILGLYAGYGNTDCGLLRTNHIDPKSGFIKFERPKTGIPRKCWLPPRAMKYITDIMPNKPGLVFKTRRGNAWAKDSKQNPIAVEWKKLADSVGVVQTFYALRHTAYTIAGSSKDKDARSYFAGHAWSGLAEIYNEDFDDQRLVVIGQIIDKWLGVLPAKPGEV
jgi:integrase